MAFTRHAIMRGQQRGITLAQIDTVLKNADKEIPRGRGCAAIWISRRELKRIGPRTSEGIPTDRLQGLIVVRGVDDAAVTAFRTRRCGGHRRSSLCARVGAPR
jgi:hypothetical protein